jgi:hypothetical protein
MLAVDAPAVSAKPSPKAQFTARVRAIGAEAQRAILAMPTSSSAPAAQARMADRLQRIYRRVAERLAALAPPTAIKADFKILVASYRADARNAGRWHDALLHGNAQQAADASRALYVNPLHVRTSAAISRMTTRGYYFGTFYR